jgi:hypothetical protein
MACPVRAACVVVATLVLSSCAGMGPAAGSCCAGFCVESSVVGAQRLAGDACDDHETALLQAVEAGDRKLAYATLRRMHSRCTEARYRSAQQLVASMDAPVTTSQPRKTPSNFRACLDRVQAVGVPPWDPGFTKSIHTRPILCSAEDLDDAVAVVRHQLKQQCAEKTATVHRLVTAGDVDEARATVATAHLQCTPQELAALKREVELTVTSTPPGAVLPGTE